MTTDNELLSEIQAARDILNRATALQEEIRVRHTPQISVLYDAEVIQLTPRFIGALLELMRAQCQMMDALPGHEGCWWWGRCHIEDLASQKGLRFVFGGREDLPADGRGRFAVIGWGEE